MKSLGILFTTLWWSSCGSGKLNSDHRTMYNYMDEWLEYTCDPDVCGTVLGEEDCYANNEWLYLPEGGWEDTCLPRGIDTVEYCIDALAEANAAKECVDPDEWEDSCHPAGLFRLDDCAVSGDYDLCVRRCENEGVGYYIP